MLVLLTALLPAFSMQAVASDDEDVEQQVQEAAAQAVAEAFPEVAHRLKVEVGRISSQLRGGNTGTLQVDISGSNGIPRGRLQAPVRQRTEDGAWQDAGWALLRIAHYDSVMVPTETLRNDSEVTSNQLTSVWMETTRFSGEPLHPADWEALSTQGPTYATRHLREGRALRRGDVRPPHTVERGDSINMMYERPLFQLTLRGKARQTGFAGDDIRVYVPDTGTTYRARITGPGAATWLETL